MPSTFFPDISDHDGQIGFLISGRPNLQTGSPPIRKIGPQAIIAKTIPTLSNHSLSAFFLQETECKDCGDSEREDPVSPDLRNHNIF